MLGLCGEVDGVRERKSGRRNQAKRRVETRKFIRVSSGRLEVRKRRGESEILLDFLFRGKSHLHLYTLPRGNRHGRFALGIFDFKGKINPADCAE